MDNISIRAIHRYTGKPTSEIVMKVDQRMIPELLSKTRGRINKDLNLRLVGTKADILYDGSFYLRIRSTPSREAFAAVVRQETSIIEDLRVLQRDLSGTT